METFVVVPVHPSEGLQFKVVNRLPWPSSWTTNRGPRTVPTVSQSKNYALRFEVTLTFL